MMLRLEPAWKLPTVTTTGSKTSNVRVTIVCSAVTISAAAGIGSLARCGDDPWPPAPITLTYSAAEAAISEPARPAQTPASNHLENTCRP